MIFDGLYKLISVVKMYMHLLLAFYHLSRALVLIKTNISTLP